MRNSQENLLAIGGTQNSMGTDMSGNLTSPAIYLGHVVNFSVQAVFTGSPIGAFKLQASNDPGVSANDYAKAVNWTDITSSTIAVTAAGNIAMNVVNAGYQWVRLVYTFSSGTGTITVAQIVTKGA